MAFSEFCAHQGCQVAVAHRALNGNHYLPGIPVDGPESGTVVAGGNRTVDAPGSIDCSEIFAEVTAGPWPWSAARRRRRCK